MRRKDCPASRARYYAGKALRRKALRKAKRNEAQLTVEQESRLRKAKRARRFNTRVIEMERNEQKQSPLFGKLPGEIRNNIFQLALAQYEDIGEPYPEDAYYRRPGHTSPSKLSTALLHTCRRAFTETRHIPAETAVVTLWFEGDERRPPNCSNGAYNRLLERYNSVGCTKAQVFAQSYWLQNYGLNKWFSPLPKDPKLAKIYRLDALQELTVTIRHTDWWYWESNHPLEIQEDWVSGFVAPATLNIFKLELETPMRKKNELDTIVNSLVRDWTFKSDDGMIFSAKHTEPVISTWTGSATFDGRNWEPEAPPVPAADTAQGDTAEEQPWSQPETITYHVVTLRWEPVASAVETGAST